MKNFLIGLFILGCASTYAESDCGKVGYISTARGSTSLKLNVKHEDGQTRDKRYYHLTSTELTLIVAAKSSNLDICISTPNPNLAHDKEREVTLQ